MVERGTSVVFSALTFECRGSVWNEEEKLCDGVSRRLCIEFGQRERDARSKVGCKELGRAMMSLRPAFTQYGVISLFLDWKIAHRSSGSACSYQPAVYTRHTCYTYGLRTEESARTTDVTGWVEDRFANGAIASACQPAAPCE